MKKYLIIAGIAVLLAGAVSVTAQIDIQERIAQLTAGLLADKLADNSAPEEIVFGGTGGNIAASIATSSVVTLSTSANTLISATSSPTIRRQCASRIISTRGNNIMLVFGDSNEVSSSTLSSVVGFIQAASTTVVYDSALYGCDNWYARALDAASNITVTEFQ